MPCHLDDETKKRLLEQSKTIAIIGLSTDPDKPSHRVARYLQEQGYTIIPIHPKASEILGCRAFASLQECALALHEQGRAIDIIDVFRKSDALPQVAQEILALQNLPATQPFVQLPACVWVQLGLESQQAGELLTRAGIAYEEDSCIKLEHQRLFS